MKKTSTGDEKHDTCCCVIRIQDVHVAAFIKEYQGRRWEDHRGEEMAARCVVQRIKVKKDQNGEGDQDEQSSDARKSGEKSHNTHGDANTVATACDQPKQQPETENSETSGASTCDPASTSDPTKQNVDPVQSSTSDDDCLTSSHLSGLPELRPPGVMPQGNVGTPTAHFLDAIRRCSLPPKVIAKLGLEFPRSKMRRKYAATPMDYSMLDKKRRDKDFKVRSFHIQTTSSRFSTQSSSTH